jgi:glycosyltransferase involved in cell wall biosynthesis
MFVSIIVPNYNHAAFLAQRIDSILQQSYQNFELIILDDCSIDDSREVIERYRSHSKTSKIIYNETNSGSTYKQWNKGVSLAQGELVWIAESDDFAHPDFLQTLKLAFDTEKRLGIAYCQSNRVNEKNEITSTWKSWTDNLDYTFFDHDFHISGKEYIDRFLIHKNTIPNASAVLFKKDVFWQVGGADERVPIFSDWLTWLKMLLISDISFTPLTLNNFRYHANSVVFNAKKKTSNEQMCQYIINFRITFKKHLEISFKRDAELKMVIDRNKKFIYQYKIQKVLYNLKSRRPIKAVIGIIKRSFSLGYNLKSNGKQG